MKKTAAVVSVLALGFAVGAAVSSRMMSPAEAQGAVTAASLSAVPGAIGAQDISGPYEVQAGWPKDLASGRFQKFRPRAGANPATLIGKPVYSAWR